MKSADIIEPFLKNLRVEELGGKFLIIVKKAVVEPFLTAVSGTGGFQKQFQLIFTLPLQLSNLGLLHTADHQFAFVVTDTDQNSQDMEQLFSRGNYHTLSQL